MANVNRPMGLVPIAAGAGEIRTRKYYVAAGASQKIRIGDPVTISGSSDARGCPSVVRSTVGSGYRITGAVTGVAPVDPLITTAPDLNSTALAASTAGYVWVADDPFQYFMIQDDGTGYVLSAGDVGRNTNLVSTVSGGLEMDATPLSTTTSYQLNIKRLIDSPDNAFGSYANWAVTINTHTSLPDGGITGT